MQHQPNFTGLRVGDVLPPPPQSRSLQVGEIDPVWFAFTTPPLAEVKARAWLEKKGVAAWMPTEKAWRKLPKARPGFRHQIEYERMLVPRYVFGYFTGRPQWDLLKASRYLSGVVGHAGKPMAITDADLCKMENIPERLRAIRAQAERERTICAGDKVRILDGVMEGWLVDVQSVHNGIARFIVPILGETVSAIEVARLSKTQGLAS